MKKTILSIFVAGALGVGIPAQAQQAQQAQQSQKQWKDRAEYDLFEQIRMENDPAKRLALLEKWKMAYPQSDFADVRLKAYLATYQQQNNHRAAFDTAAEILKAEPNDQAAIQEVLGYIRALMPQQPNAQLTDKNKADLQIAEQTARNVIANADKIYGPDKKPQGVSDDVWAKTKPTMVNFAQFTLGYIAATEKDLPKAEEELKKTLQQDPTNAQASYMLAGILLGQQKDHPEKMPAALFEYARAAAYDGPNSLDANARKQIDSFLTNAYTKYHGSAQGLDQVKMQAKAAALPPADFKIKSTVEIAQEEEAKRQELAKQNPSLAFWNTVKDGLTGDNAQTFWDAMNGTQVPGDQVPGGKIHAKLISTSPETRPKELKLAVSGDNPEITIKLDEPLPGKMDPGGEIAFAGVAKEYTKDPFMVTFEASPDDIEGWTGKGPAPARTGGASKKGAATKKKQ
jgi:hypothetical protein